jgi:protein-disulfide isomerase
MNKRTLAGAIALMALIFSTASAADKKATDSEVLRSILEELRQIHQIFAEAGQQPEPSQARPAHAKIDVSKDPVLGSDDAPVTIVEFTDFQCPFCNKFHTDTLPKLKEYIDSGWLRFVSRDLPLPMHDNAQGAAEAARCAGDQKQFWAMRDWMSANPSTLKPEDLILEAGRLGLDVVPFRDCLSTNKYKKAVQDEVAKASELGLTGTPAFIVGKTAPTVEGDVIMGAQPIAAFERAIQALEKEQ